MCAVARVGTLSMDGPTRMSKPEFSWRAFSIRQGFNPWRTLPDGTEIHRRDSTIGGVKHTGYRAFAPGVDDMIATFHVCIDGRSGHVRGDFSAVQGADAPCQSVTAWMDHVCPAGQLRLGVAA